VDEVEKRKFLMLPGIKLRLLGRPARSQSLYRLRSPSRKVGESKNYGRSESNYIAGERENIVFLQGSHASATARPDTSRVEKKKTIIRFRSDGLRQGRAITIFLN
jgi:hypothetical protein